MIVVDLNILLYAINPTFEHHAKIKKWWETSMNGNEPIGLAWIVLLGFMRISTNPRIFPNPLSTETAIRKIDIWLNHHNTQLMHESENHWSILRELLNDTGAAGNLVTDAYLAALSISNGAKLVSCDNDFARFPKLRWQNPLQEI